MVEVREKSKNLALVLGTIQQPERDVPDYLSLDLKALKGTFVRGPEARRRALSGADGTAPGDRVLLALSPVASATCRGRPDPPDPTPSSGADRRSRPCARVALRRARRHIGVIARPSRAVQPSFNWPVLLGGGCRVVGPSCNSQMKKTFHVPNLVACPHPGD